MIQVFVADDHAVVRRGLLEILAEAPDMEPVGQAGTAQETLRALRQQPCDVLLLDMAMPDGGGLEVLQQLQSLGLTIQTLVLSIYPEKQYALRALRLGAGGYLTKESAPEELLAAIRQLASGGKYITAVLAEQLASVVEAGFEAEPHEALSDREYQVMCLLAAGKSVGDVADELSLSVKTISTYRARLLDKLGLKNTAEIIRYALERGLIQ